MSDEITGAPAPAATPTPTPAAITTQEDRAWLNERLAQAKSSERDKIFRDLGVPDMTAAKAKIDAAAKADEAARALNAANAEKERLSSAVREYAGRMMMGLTDAQKAAVTKIAGEDPAKQVETIVALSETWAREKPAATAEPAAAPAATPAPAPAAPPATTAITSPAPGSGTPAPSDPRSTFKNLQSSNPFAAAQYGLRHEVEVFTPKG